MKKLIFDCDNTMGMKDRPLDDGLALLQLVGDREAEILGVTSSFGNYRVEKTYEANLTLVRDLDLDLRVFKGNDGLERDSEAGDFLVDMVNKYPGEITIIAVGSQSNLYEAYLKDGDFYNKLDQLILMGGLEKELIIRGERMEELNFSCDPEASENVLSFGKNITIMSGHIGLEIGFGPREYERLESSNRGHNYILENSKSWLDFVARNFKREEFYIWDLAASMYLSHRELFKDDYKLIRSSREDLKSGYLREDLEGNKINIPKAIVDIDRFMDIVYEDWKRV